MKLKKYQNRKSPITGKPYPRCQRIKPNNKQCGLTTYSGDYCFAHQGHANKGGLIIMDAAIKPIKLSDNSLVFDVTAESDRGLFTFNCINSETAEKLKTLLEDVNGIEFQPDDDS